MTKIFAFLIVAAMGLVAPAYAQSVRVISGDIEHIYGPHGEVLDDAELRARNQRAFENMQIEKQRAIETQQIEAENERLRLQRDQATLAYATAPTWDSTYGGWFSVGRHPGHGRIGISPRMGVLSRGGSRR